MLIVKNPSSHVVGGMVDNVSYTFKSGETITDGPLDKFRRVVKVLNDENGTALEVRLATADEIEKSPGFKAAEAQAVEADEVALAKAAEDVKNAEVKLAEAKAAQVSAIATVKSNVEARAARAKAVAAEANKAVAAEKGDKK